MNLPFSPSFFKRLEVYQELKGFEEEANLTWAYEKTVLQNAVSSKDLPIGKPISSMSVTVDILTTPSTSKKNLNSLDIMKSLEMRELGVMAGSHFLLDGIQLTSKGYAAGRILIETGGLKNGGMYEFYIKIWYFVIWFAFILLLLQVANSLIDLIKKISQGA